MNATTRLKLLREVLETCVGCRDSVVSPRLLRDRWQQRVEAVESTIVALAQQPAQDRQGRETSVCATCRHWDDDEGECNNPDSAIYRMRVGAEREAWHEDWGCTLHVIQPPAPPAPTSAQENA